MESQIANTIGLKYSPVAVILADDKPETALQFKPGKWGCVMFLFANAAKGRTAAFDSQTYGCLGGGVGLGFGNTYEKFPGGLDCFSYFRSSGNMDCEKGRQIGQLISNSAEKKFVDGFMEGERYAKSKELVDEWMQELPITEIESNYVLFKPLSKMEPEAETPENVIFTVDADQLSALLILANYARQGMDNVIIPQAAACQNIGIIPFNENKSENPRAVIGMTSLSARKNVNKLLGHEYLTFAAPWKLFLEMEDNVSESFLLRPTWKSMRETKA